jgi:6-pyruvoyltetrahydropterin/6-carboxytetrahydropterin synthase
MEGDIINEEGSSDQGMVIDFSDIKTIANKLLDDQLDHGFMYYEGDDEMKALFETNKIFAEKMEEEPFRAIAVPFIPTAENIAKYIYDKLAPQYEDKYGTGLRLKRIRLFETPNSYADYEK